MVFYLLEVKFMFFEKSLFDEVFDSCGKCGVEMVGEDVMLGICLGEGGFMVDEGLVAVVDLKKVLVNFAVAEIGFG